MRRSTLAFLLLLTLVLSAAAKPKLPMLVQTDWLEAHMGDTDIVVLYIGVNRTAYDAAHIPDARFMPVSDLAATRNGIPNQLPTPAAMKAAFEKVGVGDKSLVILMGDAGGLFAARAWFALDYLGHANKIALLDGGLEKWKAEHRPLVATETSVTPGSLTIKPNPAMLVALPAMKEIVAARQAVLIDARPPAEFSGSTPGDGVPRGGHLPGAQNVFWVDNLVSISNPVLKPVAEMQKKYEAAGVKRGRKLIVYCRTGVQASHDYFTLKLLGFQPVLYEGSFFEWSNAPGTAVETAPTTAR